MSLQAEHDLAGLAEQQGETDSFPLFKALMELAHLLGRASAETMRRHGITPPQFLILSLLAEAPYLQQQDIAARLHVTKGNVSQIVATLEREGFLAREGGRSVLGLTARAGEVLEALRPIHAQQLEASFAPLGPEERRDLARLLASLRSGLLAQGIGVAQAPEALPCPLPDATPANPLP